jgi:hypothetical protein
VLRPTAAFLVVFGLAATAGAAWGTGKYFVDEYFGENHSAVATPALQESVKRVTRQSAKTPSSDSVVPSAPKTGNDEAALEEEPLSPEAPSNSAEATAARSTAARPVARSSKPAVSGASSSRDTADSTTMAAAPPGTGNASDAVLVLQGLRALRHDGDPKEAARLLEEYRERVPDGALAEEALALSIEAALARGDESAAQLAETYLSRYPNGRFRDAAKRAKAKTRAED